MSIQDHRMISDKPISRCPNCGAWRWRYRCWICVPKTRLFEEAA